MNQPDPAALRRGEQVRRGDAVVVLEQRLYEHVQDVSARLSRMEERHVTLEERQRENAEHQRASLKAIETRLAPLELIETKVKVASDALCGLAKFVRWTVALGASVISIVWAAQRMGWI